MATKSIAIGFGLGPTFPAGALVGETHPGNNFLLETGFNLLLETGDALLLE